MFSCLKSKKESLFPFRFTGLKAFLIGGAVTEKMKLNISHNIVGAVDARLTFEVNTVLCRIYNNGGLSTGSGCLLEYIVLVSGNISDIGEHRLIFPALYI